MIQIVEQKLMFGGEEETDFFILLITVSPGNNSVCFLSATGAHRAVHWPPSWRAARPAPAPSSGSWWIPSMDLEHHSDFGWTESGHKTLRTDTNNSTTNNNKVFTQSVVFFFLLLMFSSASSWLPKSCRLRCKFRAEFRDIYASSLKPTATLCCM